MVSFLCLAKQAFMNFSTDRNSDILVGSVLVCPTLSFHFQC